MSFYGNQLERVGVLVPFSLGRCPLWLSFVWEVYQLAVLFGG